MGTDFPIRKFLQEVVQEACRASWIWTSNPDGQIETTCLQAMYQGRVETIRDGKNYPRWHPFATQGRIVIITIGSVHPGDHRREVFWRFVHGNVTKSAIENFHENEDLFSWAKSHASRCYRISSGTYIDTSIRYIPVFRYKEKAGAMISPPRGDLQDSVPEVCRAPWIWKYKPDGQIETTCLHTMYQGRVESTLDWKEYPKWDPCATQGRIKLITI
jgi:hypothetical protein